MSHLSAFHFTEAIVCRVPDIILPNNNTSGGTPEKVKSGNKKKGKNQNGDMANGVGKENSDAKIDPIKCRAEYEGLVAVLREIGLDVVELPPPDNSCPMSFLVGDIALVINGMGFVTRPKSEFRQAEVKTIRTMLKNELDIPVIVVDDQKAFVEAADILFTGRELFVGISDYTNVAGARFLAKTFPEYPCSPIKVPGPFHLTHYVNMASPDVICVGAGADSQDVIKRMERESSFRYQTLTVAEDQAANVLFVNGTLIHLSPIEIPSSYKVFTEKLHAPRKVIELTELSKVSANLSRLIILLNKSKKKSVRP